MSHAKTDAGCSNSAEPCAPLPQSVRMNFFHGQLISESDLKLEQAYFREKLRHHHRCIHGYGVICGMEVIPVPEDSDCTEQEPPENRELRRAIREAEKQLAEIKEAVAAGAMSEEEAREREAKIKAELEELRRRQEDEGVPECADANQVSKKVTVTCGAAVDCEGHDLILADAATIDLVAGLSSAERSRLEQAGEAIVYITVCYQECGANPMRPLAMDSCATTNACQYSRITEGVVLKVSLDPPAEDARCDVCCDGCAEPCLLLASVHVDLDDELTEDAIDYSLRRRFGTYDPTVITGISWHHGKAYSQAEANEILGTRDENGGIEIRFSKPVHVSTLERGVIDLARSTGRGGLAGVLTMMSGEYVGLPDDEDFVDRVRYRDTTGETVQPGDRIMLTVRAPFILDACCRPVEGLHVGGRVPMIEAKGEPAGEASAEAARREREAELKKRKEAERAASGESEVEDVIVVTGSRRVCEKPFWGPGEWTTSQPGNFETWIFIEEQ